MVLCVQAYPATAPESSKQGGQKSFREAHDERQTGDAEGVEFEAPKASRGVKNGDGSSEILRVLLYTP